MIVLRVNTKISILLIVYCALLVAGCGSIDLQRMINQPRYEPLEKSTFFEDNQASRQLPSDTVARGQLRTDEHLYTGKVNGELVETFPFTVTKDVLLRGQERYNIYCAPCHSELGDGNGMIVQRGFPQPPSFHQQRLRDAPVGHFYDVITNGFGRMYDYSDKIMPRDRWAIVAYVRALQLSQNATIDDVPANEQQSLEGQ